MIVHNVPIQTGCICDSDDPNGDKYVDSNPLIRQEKLEYEELWKQFGPMYCICLQTRPDRLESASKEFHRFGLCRHIKFYRPQPPTDEECKKANVTSHGRFGCWNSQETVAKLIFENEDIESGMEWEDDIRFRRKHMSVNRLKQVVKDWKTIVKPRGYDAFKLGQHTRSGEAMDCTPNILCSDKILKNQLLSRVYKSTSVLNHAVVWSRRGAEKLLKTSFVKNKAKRCYEEDIDVWMISEGLDMYNCYPQLVTQSGSLTSNVQNSKHTWADRIERVYWPMVGNYFQRHYCDELDWFALYIIPNLTMVLGILLLGCLMFAWRMWERQGSVKDDRSNDNKVLPSHLDDSYSSNRTMRADAS
jgi:hypothetical protein